MFRKTKEKAKERVKKVKEEVKGKFHGVRTLLPDWNTGHSTPNLGTSPVSSLTRRPASVAGDSTLLGTASAENSGSQSQAVLCLRSGASSGPTDTTTVEFESLSVAQVPQVTVSSPEDPQNPAIAVLPTHNPEQLPVSPLPPGAGVPTADNSSTPAILNTPGPLPPPTATTLSDTPGDVPGDVPGDALGDALGDTPGGIPSLSVPPPAVPSVLSTSLLKSQENLASGTSAKPSELSLWAKAFARLSEEDKKALQVPLPDTNKALEFYIGDVLEATKKSRDICVGEKMKFTVWGKNIIVRDVADKILTWVEKFKDIGDCGMQYDPVHAALPWALVRFLLQIALNRKETMEAVLIGVERVARPLVRCALYEMLYLEPGLGLLMRKSLEGALEEFYRAVLEFLAFANRYFDKSSPGRMFHGLLEVDGKSNFSPVEEKEAQLLKAVQAAETELRRRDHDDLEHKTLSAIEDRHKELKLVLDEMEMPIARIDLNVGQIQHDMRSYIEGEKRNKILKWISEVEYERHHRNARANLLENTGRWLFDKKEFREWRTSSASGILWLHGIPGAGKTKLVCAVIAFLESTGQTHEPVIYFYCNQNENQRRDPTVIMQAIVKQLSVALLPCLPSHVTAIYEEREARGFAAGPLGFKESCDLVHFLLDLYAHTTIIIDALDEADPAKRGDLLEALQAIISSSNSLVKIFIASRDDVDIKLELEKVPNLYIRAADNGGDINRFIRREVEASIGRRGLLWGSVTNELKGLIISTVAKKADGMFQWAALRVTHLCKMKLEHDIKSSLGKLPKTLEDTYSQTWEDALLEGPYAQKLREKALMWVMYALEPLNQEQWADASYWPDEVPEGGVLTLFKLCRNLVTWDKERELVVFAHLSVREYIEARKFTAIDAHSLAAESCLSFLNNASDEFVCIQNPDTASFSSYSASFWGTHCQYLYDEGKMSEGTNNLLRGFLGTAANPGPGYSRSLRIIINSYPDHAKSNYLNPQFVFSRPVAMDVRSLCSIPPNPLFALCYFPFMAGFQDLFEFKGADINCKNQWGQSLFFVAVARDNEWAMDILLRKGAKVNVGNSETTNPLMKAMKEGKVRIVIRLIKEGGKAPGRYPDVLHLAAHEGNREVLETVMAINDGCKINSTVLAMAAENSIYGTDLVQMLFTRDVDIEVTEAVWIAAIRDRYDSREIAEMLVAKCASFEITTAFLIAAANNQYGGDKIVEVLLAKFASFEITEAVLIAVIEGCDESRGFFRSTLEKILLDKRIDIEITAAVMIVVVGMEYTGVLESLLIRDTKIAVTEEVLVAAAKNRIHAGEMLDLLVDRYPGIEITAAVLISAIKVFDDKHKFLKVMLAECADGELTEAVLITALSGCRSYETVEALFARYPGWSISEAAMVAAAKNQSCGHQLTQMLIARNTQINTTEAVLVASALYLDHSHEITEMLVKGVTPEVSEGVLVAAAENRTHGDEIMQMLLDKCADSQITEKVLRQALSGRNSIGIETIEILLNKCADSQITEDVLITAVGNKANVSKAVLAKCASTLITEEVLLEAMGRWSFFFIKTLKIETLEIETLEMLFNKCADSQITEKVLIAAAEYRADALKLLLAKCANTLITEEFLIAAAQNNAEALEMLLAKCSNTLISEEVLIVAAKNSEGHKAIETLLAKCAKTLITEEVLITAVENGYHGPKIIEMLLAVCADTEITEEIVIAATRTLRHSNGVLAMLLAKCDETQVTNMEMISAAGETNGENVQEVFRPRASEKLITESVLVAATEWTTNLEFLLPKYANIPITEAVFVAAAGSSHALEILPYLQSRGHDIPITEAVVVAAAGVYNGKKALQFLKSRDTDIPITEAVLVAAAGSNNGKKVLQFLLSRGADIPITEAVVVAAAGFYEGVEVLEFLLSRNPDIPITEKVVVAAVASRKTLQLLLAEYPDIPITEAIVVAAAARNEILQFLLAEYPDIPITEAVLVAAAGSYNGKKALQFLLSRGADIPITEAIVVAAAGFYKGVEVLEFLLSRNPDIPITEKVVVAGAGGYSSQVLPWLLSRHPEIPITEAVLVAAAGGHCGMTVLRFLLSRETRVDITEAVLVAAAGSKDSMQIRLLLARVTSISITDKIKEEATRNPRFGKRIMKLLLAKEANLQSSPSPPMLNPSEDIDEAGHPTAEAVGVE